MADVVIVSGLRTAIGSFMGGLGGVGADALGAVVIRAALARAGVEAGEVSDVILGQVLTAGQGQNPARQAAIKAGLPTRRRRSASTWCAARGLRAVAFGCQALQAGDASVVVAGGQESMSLAPHCAYLRGGAKMGSAELVDTMIKDGLWDAFNGYHMGNTAENVAKQVADHPRAAGRVRGRLAAQGGGGAGGGPVQGRDRAGRRSRAARATSSSTRTSTSAPAPRPRRWPSCGRRSARTARSPRATRPASTTAPRCWC